VRCDRAYLNMKSRSESLNSAVGVKKRRRRERTKQRAEKMESKSGRDGSVSWTVLVIGLLYSLLNVVYMKGFVDGQDQHRVNNPLERVGADQVFENKAGPGDTGSESDKHDEDHDIFADKERIFHLLAAAGVRVDPQNDKDLISDLPTWSEVVGLYGSEPVIYGLEECDRFKNMSDPADHFVSTAGTFNSGTNLMAELLIGNCHMQARMDKYGAQNRGVRWQVPWGKHTPPGDEDFRQTHKTLHDKSVDANNILPAVTIRDPLVWLHSMCRHEYTASWHHPDKNRCPDFSLLDLEAKVEYAEFTRRYESILHLWNDYYREYQSASFPRLIVRFEDLIFHPEEVTKTVCECAGGSMRRDGRFKYIVDSAKKGENAHGKVRTGYVDAIVKYGSETRRYQDYQFRTDLEYIRDKADPELMKLMGYPAANPDKASL